MELRLASPRQPKLSVNILSDRFQKEEPHLQQALKDWKDRLGRLARPIDSNVVVDGRVKELHSVLGKAYKNGPKFPRTWESFGDLVALKVVFPTLAGSDAFTDALEAHAKDDGFFTGLDRRVSKPDELAYAANQFDLCNQAMKDSTGSGIKVEVQVRTIAGDAWYMIDHRLRYKGAAELTDEMERRVLRLIVLAELFDSEVDSLIKDVEKLESAQLAGLFSEIKTLFSEFTSLHTKPARPEGLFEQLVSAYPESERKNLVKHVRDFLAEDGDRVKQVMGDHTFGSSNFVERYDWLYMQPESLLVADLARRPRMLTSALKGSDFENMINPMIEHLKPS